MPQTTDTPTKFLAKLAGKIVGMKKPTEAELRPLLDEVFIQGGHYANFLRDEDVLKRFYSSAVDAAGGVQIVAERAGVSAETVESWLAKPMDMRLSESRRLDLAANVKRTFEVTETEAQP